MTHLIRRVGMLLLVTVLAVILFPWIMRALGYYVDNPGWEVGEIAAKKQNPHLCGKLFVYSHIFGPTSSQRRAECIFRYASITHDPTACEGLMPSEYGWDCLGEISGAVFEGKPCRYSSVQDDVYCNKNFSAGELTIEHPQMENCSLYKRNDLREWCHFERTAQLKETHECNAISHSIVHDYCEYNYAIKMRNPLLCGAVKDGKRREFCTTYVSLSVKYLGSGSAVP